MSGIIGTSDSHAPVTPWLADNLPITPTPWVGYNTTSHETLNSPVNSPVAVPACFTCNRPETSASYRAAGFVCGRQILRPHRLSNQTDADGPKRPRAY